MYRRQRATKQSDNDNDNPGVDDKGHNGDTKGKEEEEEMVMGP